MSHIRRMNSVAIAVTGEAASDGSLAMGVNLNFSLDSRRGLGFSRQPLAGAGALDARVYATSTTTASAIRANRSEKAR